MRTLTVAAVQMDANPAPAAERLARTERLVVEAARAGAQLVVLPELFNTGYGYSDENHRRAERLDGSTATWMRETAARLNVHLAGSLMALEQVGIHADIYNALLLFAPDGRTWRYDKSYPWGWERGYFRRSRRSPRVTVAQTDLGDLGLLICWDAGHRSLWRQYAGRVDAMVIASCPPNFADPVFHFPDGTQITADDMGPLMASLKDSARKLFGDMLNQQTAWLGVPLVNTVGCGHIRTDIPHGRLAVLGYALVAPWLLKYVPQADRMQAACDLTPGCKVVDATGEALAERTQEQGEGFAIAEVHLPEEKPVPQGPQPASQMFWPGYLMSDVLLPLFVQSTYRRGLRRVLRGSAV